MKYISLKTLIEKYIEGSTIDFCTDDSAYGFVIGLTRPDDTKIIIKLNLNYYSPYGKRGALPVSNQICADVNKHSKFRILFVVF